jgi:hypothetical protein
MREYKQIGKPFPDMEKIHGLILVKTWIHTCGLAKKFIRIAVGKKIWKSLMLSG